MILIVIASEEEEEFDPPTDVALVEEALKVSNIPPETIALVLANYTKICVNTFVNNIQSCASNLMKAELKNDNEEEDRRGAK